MVRAQCCLKRNSASQSPRCWMVPEVCDTGSSLGWFLPPFHVYGCFAFMYFCVMFKEPRGGHQIPWDQSQMPWATLWLLQVELGLREEQPTCLTTVPWVGSEYLHFNMFCVCFWDGLMRPPGWPWTLRVTEDDLEHLTSASEFWDHRQGLCGAGDGTQGPRRHPPAELHT